MKYGNRPSPVDGVWVDPKVWFDEFSYRIRLLTDAELEVSLYELVDSFLEKSWNIFYRIDAEVSSESIAALKKIIEPDDYLETFQRSQQLVSLFNQTNMRVLRHREYEPVVAVVTYPTIFLDFANGWHTQWDLLSVDDKRKNLSTIFEKNMCAGISLYDIGKHANNKNVPNILRHMPNPDGEIYRFMEEMLVNHP